MKRIFLKIMLSCKKATELIEKRTIQNLTNIENMQLKLHLSFCALCHAYEHQSKKIDTILSKHLGTSGDELIAPIENQQLKEKILKSVKKN